MNSSHREELTFNSRLTGEPGFLETHALTYVALPSKKDPFFTRLMHFFLESFSRILQKTGTES